MLLSDFVASRFTGLLAASSEEVSWVLRMLECPRMKFGDSSILGGEVEVYH